MTTTTSAASRPATRSRHDGETIAFWILATIAVAGALGCGGRTKAVYSAIALASTMIALAVLYVSQDALFLGVVQVVVYTGAVMMLFLFVLMLIGVDSSESLVETIRGQRVAAIAAGLGFGILLIAGIGSAATTGFIGLERANAGGNVQGLAMLIFTRDLWPSNSPARFSSPRHSGRWSRLIASASNDERPRGRWRWSASPREDIPPMPNPGVYARHNAVDTPARLPDGSDAENSVAPILHAGTSPGRSGEQ